MIRTRALADTSASGCRYERPRKQASYQQVKNYQAKDAGSCVLCGVLIPLSLGARVQRRRKKVKWMERKYQVGNVVEKIVGMVGNNTKPRKKRKINDTGFRV